MDNPSYFQTHSQPDTNGQPPEPEPDDQEELFATFKVDDNEARKHLDENFNILSSRVVSAESPSVKLMKKCSLRRLLSQKPQFFPPPTLELKRSQSLTQQETNSNEFIVGRSKSFSASWATSSKSINMSHETSRAVKESPQQQYKRNSFGSVPLRRQQHTIIGKLNTYVPIFK